MDRRDKYGNTEFPKIKRANSEKIEMSSQKMKKETEGSKPPLHLSTVYHYLLKG